MAHLNLQNVSFDYPIYHMAGRSLKVSVARRISGAKHGEVLVRAVRDLSLKLKEGDRLGLIGRNGSGKSTLLRIIAGLAHPQRGVVDIEGRVIPLIERGLGINLELSGADNIELPLRFLGASEEEIRQAKQTVPEFTSLGEFINMPVRTYSEGMKARLAFALCTAIHGDILVLDEWLGAGDINFTDKAQARLTGVVDRARILVIASHSLELLRSVCTHVLWMEGGRVVMHGPTEEVIAAYVDQMRAEPNETEQ